MEVDTLPGAPSNGEFDLSSTNGIPYWKQSAQPLVKALKVNSDGSVETSGGKVNTTLTYWKAPSSFKADCSLYLGITKPAYQDNIETTITSGTPYQMYCQPEIRETAYASTGIGYFSKIIDGVLYVSWLNDTSVSYETWCATPIVHIIQDLQHSSNLGMALPWTAVGTDDYNFGTAHGIAGWEQRGPFSGPTGKYYYPTSQDSSTKKVTLAEITDAVTITNFTTHLDFTFNDYEGYNATLRITFKLNGTSKSYSDIPIKNPWSNSELFALPMAFKTSCPNGEITDLRDNCGSPGTLTYIYNMPNLHPTGWYIMSHTSSNIVMMSDSYSYGRQEGCYVEGNGHTAANIPYGHIEGHGNRATDDMICHVEGAGNVSYQGKYSHIEGAHNYNYLHNYNHLEGRYNRANYQDQHVGGVANAVTDGYEVIGMGTVTSGKVTERKNARVLTKQGLEQARGFLPLTTVTAVPTAAPSFVGEMQWDSTNKRMYFATGTSAVSDWKVVTLGALPSEE